MTDIHGNNHAEKVFWVDYDGIRAFSTQKTGGDVLAEYVKVEEKRDVHPVIRYFLKPCYSQMDLLMVSIFWVLCFLHFIWAAIGLIFIGGVAAVILERKYKEDLR
ncbi:MAG: hypothetical protein RIA09_15965 [Hoeflea sp.]|uniref:hypothetical protein n=1 Tax=Hoeflea sp. TaxID=1940281 RepID=UPI0032EE6A5D